MQTVLRRFCRDGSAPCAGRLNNKVKANRCGLIAASSFGLPFVFSLALRTQEREGEGQGEKEEEEEKERQRLLYKLCL